MKSERQRYSDAELQTWLDCCDPGAPAEPMSGSGEKSFYYPLDQWNLRGGALKDIVPPIRLKPNGSCQLVSGFSGTGKSTELLQMKRELEDQGYLVLLVNVLDYLTLTRPLEIEDLLVTVAGAIEDLTAVHVPPNKPGFWEGLLNTLRELKLDSITARFKVIDLKLNVKQGKPLWQEAQGRLSMAPGKLRTVAHDNVISCLDRLARRYPKNRGIVLIFDNLEKLRSSTVGFRVVLNSALRTFIDYADELHLPGCHVIYTVPPYLPLLEPNLSFHYDKVTEVLPAVRIENFIPKTPFKPRSYRPGVQALRGLVRKRVPIELFFGKNSRQLDILIRYSGGHVRTLIAMVRELVYQLEKLGGPLAASDMREVIAVYQDPAVSGLGGDHLRTLNRIQATASISEMVKDSQDLVAELMERTAVLCYRKGKTSGWYLVNPLIRDYVRLRSDDPVEAGPTSF